MKKFVVLYLLVLSGLIIHAQTKNEITQDVAWGKVKEIVKEDLDSVNVFVSYSVLTPNKTISTWNGNETSPAFESWFFFIDDMPFCNWTHPCRYVYVNSIDGKVTIHYKRHPPLNIEMKPLKQKRINSNHGLFDFSKLPSHKSKQRASASSNHQYAVIISGGGNVYYNYERYWNDCSAIYQTLVNVYGYSKQNIYVLMADGTDPTVDRHLNNGTYESSPLDLDGDGLADIQYDATRSSITSVFNILNNTLTEDDDLFIFTTDHGDTVGGNHVAMCLWNGEILHDYEFATYLNSISANQINVCMGQCYSGGFIDNISTDNIVISTACRYDERSYARQDFLYDEYVYHWISAVAGETPYGVTVNADTNNDGYVSMSEAFEYANTNDLANEHPQYYTSPLFLGHITDITGECILNIGGTNILYDTATYNIQNLPSGYAVSWSLSGTNASNFVLQNNSPSANQCTITRKFGESFVDTTNIVLTAQIKYNGSTLATISKSLITPHISGPTEPCGPTVYRVANLPVGNTVSWSFLPTVYNPPLNPFIVYNSPQQNQCTINSSATRAWDTNLYAYIKNAEGDTISMLVKPICNTFDLTFSQMGMTINGVTYPSIPETSVESDETIIVNHRCRVSLYSPYFENMTLTHTGATPLFFDTFNGNLSFRFSTVTTTQHMYIYGTDGCKVINLHVQVTPNSNIPIPMLEINPISDGFEILLTYDGEEEAVRDMVAHLQDIEWNLNIANAMSGEKVQSLRVKGPRTIISTIGKKPGVYVLQAIVDGQECSEKITIK